MNERAFLLRVLAGITAIDNPAAPSQEFLDLHREGQVVTDEESARIQKAINSSPVSQIGDALKAIVGIAKSFLT